MYLRWAKAMIFISNLLLFSTDKAMVLKHHPDKRKAAGEQIVEGDNDYFTCITKGTDYCFILSQTGVWRSVLRSCVCSRMMQRWRSCPIPSSGERLTSVDPLGTTRFPSKAEQREVLRGVCAGVWEETAGKRLTWPLQMIQVGVLEITPLYFSQSDGLLKNTSRVWEPRAASFWRGGSFLFLLVSQISRLFIDLRKLMLGANKYHFFLLFLKVQLWLVERVVIFRWRGEEKAEMVSDTVIIVYWLALL